ncbi:KH domain-containing protein [Calidifontibacillus erzurumensis]|uniref:RNA-binding protein KhpA n=1 Tax=Calidifontibacillus erzurumensis TaxID=2741433 RepID=A0A8J8GG75_9BACI|nr:KH domain-containing protein [Calidifontibacillus erzurumensis]NSL51208.1 KH domain-containing protein [Calidifontibacillus erzurumensis]
MTALIETIVKSLVDHPDDIVITKEEDDKQVVYRLTVHKEDIGKVIGKQGRIAKAIRTVLHAAHGNEEKKIHLDIM